MKKFLSLFLSIVMLLSITAGIDFSASAANYYESESNDSFYSADNLPLNSSITGNSSNRGDDPDYFKITTSKNGKLDITLKHDKGDTDAGWYFEVFKKVGDDYVEMSYQKVIKANQSDYKYATIGVTENSTYYIRITGTYYLSNNYDYTLTNKFTATEDFEKEFNDSFYSANVLKLNSSISGNSNCEDAGKNRGGDDDYYKVPVKNNCKLSIKFSHDKADTDGGWHVYVYKKVNDSYKKINYKWINSENGNYTFPTINGAKGDYYICVFGNPDYVGKLNYTITAKEIKDTNVTVKLNRNIFAYNGKVQKPSVTVTNSKGKKLTVNKDYTVTYSNSSSKNVGKYIVTVKMKGNYGGTKTIGYKINPKPTEFVPSNKGGFKAISKGFTLKWNKQSSQTTGYQIQYATKRDFSNAATITIANPNTTSKTIKGRAGNKRYYVRVRTYKKTSSSTFYSGWNSGVKSVVTLR